MSLHEQILRERVSIFRGFDGDVLDFARALGEILEWEFGAVNELTPHDDPRNYLYTSNEVPFHWDGAFARVPRYIVFHCLEPGRGGETLFCDTPRLIAAAHPDEISRWQKISITYSTEKLAHYGGRFTSPLIARHPQSGETILRYAEPVDDLNPVHLEVHGALDRAGLARRLRDFSYAHTWRAGDLVVADNHALLHGRRAFQGARHLRRVNVL
jgi:alpha-ketoglutarate-dependent taurine dioxygenase